MISICLGMFLSLDLYLIILGTWRGCDGQLY